MEILGVGPLEILFIFMLVLIIFGPRDLQKAGRTMGRTLNKLVRSDTWQVFNQVSRKIRNLPTTLMREANLDDLTKVDPAASGVKTSAYQQGYQPVEPVPGKEPVDGTAESESKSPQGPAGG